MEGRLAHGVAIEAMADLRGDAPFRLELAVETADGVYTTGVVTELAPEDEGAAEAEYAGLMAHFVDAAVRGVLAPAGIAEILQCHRELLQARATATTPTETLYM